MYLISDLCYVCLYKIGRYRTTVVRRNLANSFPDKTLADRKQIEKKFYRQLFDLMVETYAANDVMELRFNVVA